MPTLLARVRQELAVVFAPDRPMHVGRAPGRLDVMGGIADTTGGTVLQLPIARAAAVAMQARDDRQLQIFSFNQFDEHLPFTVRLPMAALASTSIDTLRGEFQDPGRRWAGFIAGCLLVLHESGLVDLQKADGLNLAVHSTVPSHAGVASSAALVVATMSVLLDQFALRQRLSPIAVAELCQRVETHVVGQSAGIKEPLTSLAGQAGMLLRLKCQPHELLEPIALPAGVQLIGITTGIKPDPAAALTTRCAAFIGQKMIFELMRQMGQKAGREMIADPLNGYLANLDGLDYKRFFRPYLPEKVKGGEFLLQFRGTLDPATRIAPDVVYHVQQAVDHHVLESKRIANFSAFLQQAGGLPADSRERFDLLNKAGHLMYASHISYTNDALLGRAECDLLVKLIRDREHEGFYGGKLTGIGTGGTIAVLAEQTDRAMAAVDEVINTYHSQTGQTAEVLIGSSGEALKAD